ncbi:MAG: TlpA family protein disulfide reductase [Myxococcaceae bacterium]|nr:TlpA family protein disulfide reductase [Myxococcaceae bacterium]
MLARARATWARWNQRRAVRWGVDLALFALVLLGAGWWQTRGHMRGELPALTLPRLGTDEAVALSSFKGRPTVLAFWAPWCGVCKQESPNLSRAQRWLGDRARIVSVVGSYQGLEEVQRTVDQTGIDYPVLLADDRTLETFGVHAFPTLYFVDAEGHITGSASGYTTTLGVMLRTLL